MNGQEIFNQDLVTIINSLEKRINVLEISIETIKNFLMLDEKESRSE